MTIAVDMGRKATKTNKQNHSFNTPYVLLKEVCVFMKLCLVYAIGR